MDELASGGAAYSCAASGAADAEHESKHSSGADYVIAWRDRDTGREGHGISRFHFAAAESLCAELNQENPQFEHWPKKERAHVEIAQG